VGGKIGGIIFLFFFRFGATNFGLSEEANGESSGSNSLGQGSVNLDPISKMQQQIHAMVWKAEFRACAS
jgi:hypothetical protein